MSEVTLLQILGARDRRAEYQKKLIGKYNNPIICFTMNIAGPNKTSPMIERAFFEGLKEIDNNIPHDKIVFRNTFIRDTGCEAFFSVDLEPTHLKKICEAIEDNTNIGRLFDMDVIDPSGQKLSREHVRGCIVCAAPGRECAAGRLHPINEIEHATNKIICDHFQQHDRDLISSIAVQSLIQEVNTTPKPGLVDRSNNGSHKDMNIESFVKSANSLLPYFSDCFNIGVKTRNLPPDEAFLVLKSAGLRAEECMYAATNGANTHKGIIYSLGIICASMGRIWSPEELCTDLDRITHTCSQLTEFSAAKGFNDIDLSTAGGRCYRTYGITGIRGEVLSGFASVKEISLPFYMNALGAGYSENDAGVMTLLKLISNINDTNLYNRGGKSGAKYAADYAEMIMKKLPAFSVKDVEQMDREFINRNLSPGGCADLLAITYFFHSIKNL